MIPLAVPNLDGNEKKYLDNCIDTTFVSSVGEYVNTFENVIANATESIEAVATSSGTTGLHAALTAVGVGYGDLVILPTFTFIASANAIKHCGADPWLMDISEETWCLDSELVEQELEANCEIIKGKLIHKSSGKRVAALMPVYTLGNIPDMDCFRKLANKYRVPLVADAACAIGASYHGKSFGNLADLSVLSFNGNKTITCGGGGAVIGGNKELLEKVRHLTTTARVWPDYDFDMVGFNYRMTNIQAAVGVAQMERLEKFVNRKREIHQYYENAFANNNSLSTFPITNGASCWFSGVILPEGKTLDDAKALCAYLKENGIEARPFWKPVHLQKPYANCFHNKVDKATGLWERIITLPCSTGISNIELELVVESINKRLNDAFVS